MRNAIHYKPHTMRNAIHYKPRTMRNAIHCKPHKVRNAIHCKPHTTQGACQISLTFNNRYSMTGHYSRFIQPHPADAFLLTSIEINILPKCF